MINGRYLLHEKLGQGGMGIVHRATDRLTGDIVALKQVFLPVEQLFFASRPASQTSRELRLALTNEFQILASLRHPNIISVLDYGFDEEGRPFYTMSYFDEAVTILEAGNGRSLPEKIDLLIQMLEALAYLHRRGILHRDLKPDNVLVVATAAERVGALHLLDFGLSVAKEQATTSVGSWLYMAPEVFQGETATEASDLYAIGVMAYRLFARAHPFDPYAEDVGREIAVAEPDLSKMGVSGALTAVIGKLLAKSPDNRYQSASAVIVALCHALGQPVPQESQAIRESYLQAAKFVGRETEMAQLEAALAQAQAGRGSAWLIGGESGVGKSRLLHELRTQALVDGFVVLRGQGVEDSGGFPYQLWREPLRHLLLALPAVTDLEAAVLQPLVPDVAHLLGRDILPAPYLAGEAAQIRLFTTIAGLVARVKRPLLILLEDLHWAEASLLPIPYLTYQIEQQPILLIGTYRDDERPELAQSVPQMQPLHLARLSELALAELSQAMLGAVGQRADIVALLRRETEGNAFFAVEVVRALAEEIGRLSQIGQMVLPETLLPDGIQSIVARCLARVPLADRPLLQLAAVAGRELDLRVLRRLNEKRPLNRWLSRCAEASVLEIVDDMWQFRHAKIRDGLLALLPDEARQSQQRQVAEMIEQVYPDDPLHAAQLVYHWGQAGERAQERHYALIAGQQAAAQYANNDALILFSRAYELAETAVQQIEALLAREKIYALVGDSAARQADLLLLRELAAQQSSAVQAEVALREGRYAVTVSEFVEGVAFAKTAVVHAAAANDERLLVHAHELHGDALAEQGLFDEAEAVFSQALELAQRLEESREIANLLGRLGSIASRRSAFEQAQTYFRQSLQIHQEIGNVQGEASALRMLGQVSSDLGQTKEAEAALLESLQMAQTIGDKRGESNAINSLAIAYDEIGRHAEARVHLEAALALEQSLGSKAGVGMLYNNLGVSAYTQRAYDDAYGYFAESLAIAEGTNDKMGQGVALMNMGSTFRNRQGVYEQGERLLRRGLVLAQEMSAKDLEGGFLMHLGGIFKRLGQYEQAEPNLREALAIFREIGRRWWEGWTLLYVAEWLIAQGNYAAATEPLLASLTINQELEFMERVGVVLNGLAWVAYQTGDYEQMLVHYEAALEPLQGGQHWHETAVSHAGIALARSLLGLPDSDIAPSLAYLDNEPVLMASENPFRLYLLCYRWLRRQGDARADGLLTSAYEQLQQLADNIETAVWRDSFLTFVPEQREIVRLVHGG